MTENPVDYLVKQTGLSRGAFTRKHDLGANHLLLLSQGRKESVATKVVGALQEEAQAKGLDLAGLLHAEYGTFKLDAAYQAWIKQERQQTDLKVRLPAKPVVSPWQAIVDQVGSVSATSKLLKVRWIAVHKYLTHAEMPASIREALEDIGWTGIERLDRAQRKFFAQ